MATICPHATYDPLGPQTEPRMAAHDIVCLHTMAGTFAGVDSMFHQNGYGGTESHFGVRGDGFTKQWQDLDYQADANLDGNPRCISIETADMGETFPAWGGSDVPAWTDEQLDAIVAVVRWLCDRYDIPKQLVPDSKPGRRGIGYHRQGIDNWRVSGGEYWSSAKGKVCPGDRRVEQLTTIVIPRVRGEEEDEMTEAEWQRMSNLVDGRLRDPGNLSVITDAVLDRIHADGYKRSGSDTRTTLQEMAVRGVNLSLGAAEGDKTPGMLDERLTQLETKLDAVLEPAPDE